jgi:DNA-binding SARP family transcriptional activator
MVMAERFQHQAAVARHNLATYYLHRRDYANGIRHCKLLLRIDPLQESSHRLLMLMQARSGDRNAALAQYQKCGQILAEELGVEPADETTALYERIRQARTPPPYHVPLFRQRLLSAARQN